MNLCPSYEPVIAIRHLTGEEPEQDYVPVVVLLLLTLLVQRDAPHSSVLLESHRELETLDQVIHSVDHVGLHDGRGSLLTVSGRLDVGEMSLGIALVVGLWPVIRTGELLALLHGEVEVRPAVNVQVAEVGVLEVALNGCKY